MMKLRRGTPENLEGRQEKEIRSYRFLDEIGVEFWQLDHEEAATMEACEEIDRLLDATICKNLFLCNRQETDFYLLLMPGEKRFSTSEFCKLINSPRLSFAPEEYMVQYLNITPGSVSVMGLMNDTENQVQLYIDKDVLSEEYLGCHPCVNTASIKLKVSDVLEKFLPYVQHEYSVVEL